MKLDSSLQLLNRWIRSKQRTLISVVSLVPFWQLGSLLNYLSQKKERHDRLLCNVDRKLNFQPVPVSCLFGFQTASKVCLLHTLSPPKPLFLAALKKSSSLPLMILVVLGLIIRLHKNVRSDRKLRLKKSFSVLWYGRVEWNLKNLWGILMIDGEKKASRTKCLYTTHTHKTE